MASTDNRSSRPHPSRSRTTRALAYLWSEFRLEVMVVIVVVMAIFLLIEQMQIREIITNWFLRAVGGVLGLLGGAGTSVDSFVRTTTLSDLTAYFLLVVASILITWRLRWRLMHTPRFTDRQCPRCGGELHRIHRHTTDRLLHLFVPVRRYRCRDHDCEWSGLRVQKHR